MDFRGRMRRATFAVLIVGMLIISLSINPAIYPVSAAVAYLLTWWRIRR